MLLLWLVIAPVVIPALIWPKAYVRLASDVSQIGKRWIDRVRRQFAAHPEWRTQEWLAPRLVGVCGLCLLAGYLLDRTTIPNWVETCCAVFTFIAGGYYGAKGGLEALREHKIDVDMLMILSALGTASIGLWHEGGLLLLLFSLSNVLQEFAISRNRSAIRDLLQLNPQEAIVLRGGERLKVAVASVEIDEIVFIAPGERLPLDGIVTAGRSMIDQSPITGESIPVEKQTGDTVFAGTLNHLGFLEISVTAAHTDTLLARIIKRVEEAQDSKSPTERFLDAFEKYYAFFLLGGGVLLIVFQFILGIDDFQQNFYRAMLLITVASPCAMVISTPASFIAAIASAARAGVLFKGTAFIERLARIRFVAFDKTGTLTIGKPTVTEIVAYGMSEQDLLKVAAAAESRSEHPLGKAIMDAAAAQHIIFTAASEFDAVPGHGIQAIADGRVVRLGSPSFAQLDSVLSEAVQSDIARLESFGRSVVVVQSENDCLGLIALADPVRTEARTLIENLHSRGIQVAMLTGDNPQAANNVAAQLGIDRVYAGLLPDQKVEIVQQLRAETEAVAMVGDGINDAPALATANVGIAMGQGGTDAAMETADLVLMSDRLDLIGYAIGLSQKACRVVWQNIAFALTAMILLVLASLLIDDLPLPLAVLGHEGSTVLVVVNGLLQLLIWPEIRRRHSMNSPTNLASAKNAPDTLTPLP